MRRDRLAPAPARHRAGSQAARGPRFGIDEKGAQGTSMNIVKGLEWRRAGAKIIT